MNKLSVALTALLMLAMVVIIAPNIFALNRGHVLRNIAIWLAIFVGLALVYQGIGPGSPHPLFSLPGAMSAGNLVKLAPVENTTPTQPGDTKGDKDGDKGFTPPKEE